MKSRIFRAVLCLLVICCLLCNYMLTPARAFAFETATVSALGLTVLIMLVAAGFILPPDQTIAIVQEIDESVRQYQLDFGGQIEWPDDGDDDEENNDDITDEIKSLEEQFQEMADQAQTAVEAGQDFILKIDSKLAALFRSFLAFCIGENAIPLLGEAAPEGYAYYNGYLFYDFPSAIDTTTHPYMSYFYHSYYESDVVVFTDKPLSYLTNEGKVSFGYGITGSYYMVFPRAESPYWALNSAKPSSATSIYTGSVYFTSFNYNDRLTQEEAYLEAVAILGETAQGIQDGTKTEDDIVIPEYVNVSEFFANISGADDLMTNYNQIASDLASGNWSYSDFVDSISYSADSGDSDSGIVDGPDSEDSNSSDSGSSDGSDSVETGTISNYPVLDFFAKLGELLQNIMDGNLLGIKEFFSPWIDSIGQWFSEIRGDLSSIDSSLQDGFQDVVDSNQGLNNSVQDFAEQQNQMMQEQNQVIQDQSQSLGDRIMNGVQSLFTPSDGFIEGKVDDLRKNYAFADSIALTAVDLKNFLTSLGSVPPVIRINLGAATGSFNWGGDMVLIDFSFYDPYKPTMDAILSAFLWLWFCWRVILGLPGIIGGVSGLSGAFNDSSHVGSSGYVSTPTSSAGVAKASPVERPKFVPRPGGDAHYNEWRKNHK